MPAIFLDGSPTLRSWVENLPEKTMKRANKEKITITIDDSDVIRIGPWRLVETTHRDPFWLSNEESGVYCESPDDAWKVFLAHLPGPPQKGKIQPYKPLWGSYEPPVKDVLEAALSLFLAPLRTVLQASELQTRNGINLVTQRFSYPLHVMDRHTVDELGKFFLDFSPNHDGGLATITNNHHDGSPLSVTFTFWKNADIKGFRNFIGENNG